MLRQPQWAAALSPSPILPSNQSPLGALPRRFRRTRVLIVGCGDVGLRVLRDLAKGGRIAGGGSLHVIATTSQPSRVRALQEAGATPILGNLDEARSLRRLAGLAQRVLHLAPPPGGGEADPRTRALVQGLRRRTAPLSLVYGSTTGVYGDCGGAVIDETRALRPGTVRAKRRVDAELACRQLGRTSGTVVSLLRIPGIQAPDRPDGNPLQRLQMRLDKNLPVLRPEEDVYTSHIHADDLARACMLALWRGRPQRAVNVSDGVQVKMGDWFDALADQHGLPRPRRASREQARSVLSPMQMSFMEESRRLQNGRLRLELRLRLAHPNAGLGRDGHPFC
jgi:nucleoside-diphosphate-sugar epimerase